MYKPFIGGGGGEGTKQSPTELPSSFSDEIFLDLFCFEGETDQN